MYATDIVYWAIVPCAVVYAPIDRTLQQICDELDAQYVPFFYDWRKDVITTAKLLAQTIEDLCAKSSKVTEITLVCHSMGGLIGRLLLEATYPDPKSKPDWFSKIKRLICICTSHLGLPKLWQCAWGWRTTEPCVARM